MADINKHFYVVIVAGGGGTRLWPKSRHNTPKQLLTLTGKKTLIRSTFERVRSLLPTDQIFVITLAEHLSLVKQQLPELKEKNIIVEPEQKNTAMAMGVASAYVYAKDNQAVVINLPADQTIDDVAKFHRVMLAAFETALQGDFLVAVGIKPSFAHTGLGYIKIGDQIGKLRISDKDVYAFKSRGFKEKPDLTTAQSFIASGQYLWNAGIYGWVVSNMVEAMKLFSPDLSKRVAEIIKAVGTKDEKRVMEREYKKAENVSIDYALSEKADNLVLVPGDFGWSDVGDWKVVYDISDKDNRGNVILARYPENYIDISSKNCLVETNGRLVVTIGLEDVVVIDTEDAVLICSKDKTQDVKKAVEELKLRKKNQYL